MYNNGLKMYFVWLTCIMIKSLEFFADCFFLCLEFMSILIKRYTANVAKHFFGNVALGQLQVFRYISFVTTVSCAFPAVMFVLYGITSVILTLGGFVFIVGMSIAILIYWPIITAQKYYGFLLAIGGLCMVACIASLMLVFSVITVVAGVFYMLALKLEYMLSSFEPTSNILRAIAPADKSSAREGSNSY